MSECCLCGASSATVQAKPINGLPADVACCDACRLAIKQRLAGVVRRADGRLHKTDARKADVEPYYQDSHVTLYHGDSRDVVSIIGGSWEAVITDPVWPNAPETVPGWDEHEALIRSLSQLVLGRASRLIVHLSSTSDPRWLVNVPKEWPYLMSQQLEYAMPSYRGRSMLNDAAYAFGAFPARKDSPGQVVPGRITCTAPRDIKQHEHPAARSYQHVAGLVKWWAGKGPVLDPFAGSGTTLLACKNAGVPVVGVEREERFCELIVSRLQQARMTFELPADDPVRLETGT
jgi:site-specific DNA-methyltransferase (adenine-specific)